MTTAVKSTYAIVIYSELVLSGSDIVYVSRFSE